MTDEKTMTVSPAEAELLDMLREGKLFGFCLSLYAVGGEWTARLAPTAGGETKIATGPSFAEAWSKLPRPTAPAEGASVA